MIPKITYDPITIGTGFSLNKKCIIDVVEVTEHSFWASPFHITVTNSGFAIVNSEDCILYMDSENPFDDCYTSQKDLKLALAFMKKREILKSFIDVL